MKFTSASTATIFVLFSAVAAPFALADVVERDIIPVKEEQGANSDPASRADLGTQQVTGDDEEKLNENVAPDLLGAVQIGFANCNTKTQCTNYGQNSCETIYADCNKQCVWNSRRNFCYYNRGPSPRGPTRKPTKKPTKRPTPAPPSPGSSICTWSPDYSCYKTGQPECCSYNGGRNCPNYDTMCNNYPEGLTGWNYCTYPPDYNCYPNGGRPSCCFMSGGGTMNCPVNRPSCERSRFLRGNSDGDN